MSEQLIRHSGEILPALTGVRALAAFMVLSLHAGAEFSRLACKRSAGHSLSALLRLSLEPLRRFISAQ